MCILTEINEKISLLDDGRKKLILEIVNNFLPYSDWSDVVTKKDLHYIKIAEEEYARTETIGGG